MSKRALKHLARRDAVLLTAITRVWKARERAKLLERVKSVRLMKNSWMTWTHRMRRQKRLQGLIFAVPLSSESRSLRHPSDLALTFSSRLDTSFLSSMFHRWLEIHMTHLNSQGFAVKYYSSRLQFRLLLTWRIQLRMRMKLAKTARAANRFFVIRKAWKKMIAGFEARKREKKLRDIEIQQLDKRFRGDAEEPL